MNPLFFIPFVDIPVVKQKFYKIKPVVKKAKVVHIAKRYNGYLR